MKNLITSILLLMFSFSGFSQFFEGKNEVTNFSGYFNFNYDESEDKLFLQVHKNQLEKERSTD